jgi:hypothetical protein
VHKLTQKIRCFELKMEFNKPRSVCEQFRDFDDVPVSYRLLPRFEFCSGNFEIPIFGKIFSVEKRDG